MSKPWRIVDAGQASAKPVYGPKRHPALRWPESVRWRLSGTWEPAALMLTEKLKWKNHESESTDAEPRGGTTRSSNEVPEKGWSQRVVLMELNSMCQPAMG